MLQNSEGGAIILDPRRHPVGTCRRTVPVQTNARVVREHMTVSPVVDFRSQVSFTACFRREACKLSVACGWSASMESCRALCAAYGRCCGVAPVAMGAVGGGATLRGGARLLKAGRVGT